MFGSVRHFATTFHLEIGCRALIWLSFQQLPTNSKPQIKQVFDDVHFIFMRKCGEMKWSQHFCTQFASFGN